MNFKQKKTMKQLKVKMGDYIKCNSPEEKLLVVYKLISLGHPLQKGFKDAWDLVDKAYDKYPHYVTITKNNNIDSVLYIYKDDPYIPAKDFLDDVEQDEEDKDWYYVPPYKGTDGHRLVNAKGELVAVFEDKEEALLVTRLKNKQWTKKS